MKLEYQYSQRDLGELAMGKSISRFFRLALKRNQCKRLFSLEMVALVYELTAADPLETLWVCCLVGRNCSQYLERWRPHVSGIALP